MLIEFFVENFLSLKEQQCLNLVTHESSGRNQDNTLKNNCFQTDTVKPLHLLKSAVIYGANAAGKSNIIDALATMRKIVLISATESQRGDLLPVTPFKLSKDCMQAPTVFEIVFIQHDIKYEYGFALTPERVVAEWLFASPKGRAQRWFMRTFDQDTGQYRWEFSSLLQGQKQLWKTSTKDNSLFLSTAVLLNSTQLQPVFDWFKDTLKVSSSKIRAIGITARMFEQEIGKTQVLNFLKSADIDIDDINVTFEEIDKEAFAEELPKALREKVLSVSRNTETRFIRKRSIKSTRLDDEGDAVEFDFEKEESEGTQKLFKLAGPWINILQQGSVLVIDELHNSLHPKLVKFLVSLFHSPETNPNNAQLIFTTHETSILDQQLFSRDQVWFVEKTDNASVLFPLTDFSPRKGVENLEKGYLSGRYGALPIVNESELIGELHGH